MRNNMEKELVCVVIIRGESAKDMFLAGDEDLEDYFFPEKMGLKAEDVEVRFLEEEKTPQKNTNLYVKIAESKDKTIREVKKIIKNT